MTFLTVGSSQSTSNMQLLCNMSQMSLMLVSLQMNEFLVSTSTNYTVVVLDEVYCAEFDFSFSDSCLL